MRGGRWRGLWELLGMPDLILSHALELVLPINGAAAQGPVP